MPKQIEVDWLGTVLLFALVAIFFLGINIAQVIGYGAPVPVAMYLVSICLLISFIIWERRTEQPLLDLSIFKGSLFTLSLLASLLVFTTNFFTNVLLPFYLENLGGLPTGLAGIYMMMIPIAMMIGAPFAGILADKYDREYVTVFALTGIVISMFGWHLVKADSSMWLVVLMMALAGIGTAFFQSPNNALVMSAAAKNQLGVAGSLNALSRNLGMIIGTSSVTSALYISMSHHLGRKITNYPTGHDQIFMAGMHDAFTLAALLVIVAWVITFYRVFMRLRAKK